MAEASPSLRKHVVSTKMVIQRGGGGRPSGPHARQKRNRYGYEDGESILRRVASAVDFIWSENPLEVLGTVTSISFDDEASLPLKEHELTSAEGLMYKMEKMLLVCYVFLAKVIGLVQLLHSSFS
ncbi:hypothetical protein N665_0130s0049 [Sinapis alba]|nr:hypothetical protein N665_0130s0049 [Sinapis alba]